MNDFNLQSAAKVEITVLVDNYIDILLLQSTDVIRRHLFVPPQAPLAEHGLSCLLKIYSDSKVHNVLLDTAMEAKSLFHNAGLLQLDLSQVDSVVLSHGHYDHFGGLSEFLDNISKSIPLVLHPEAFLDRRMILQTGTHPIPMPKLDRQALVAAGAVMHETREAYSFASDLVMVTGEIERITGFEIGMPSAEAYIADHWVVDPFHDDQAVVVKVKDQGLVIVAGCSHAGIINTVRFAQKVTHTDQVYAVLGGFHLTGKTPEPNIASTIAEMKSINPKYLVPMHCTGWNAINQFSRAMPDQFLLNSVGTTYVFQ